MAFSKIHKHVGAWSRMPMLLALCAFLPTCAADGDEYGNCSLSCANAKIGPSEVTIASLVLDDMTYACSTPGSISSPIPVRFKVTRKIETLESGDGAKDNGFGMDEIGVGGVKFVPTVSGNMATIRREGLENNPEYTGIDTPSSDWCTDSCGIATFLIYPNCVANAENEVTAYITVAGQVPEKPFKITVKNGD